MTIDLLLALTAALLIKHFWLDFGYQPPYMWQNKGTFGHWGGIVHSGGHALASWIILAFATPLALSVLAGLALFEFVVHYATDWAKMNINKKMGWTATTHNEFWILTGLDQLVHQLTYVAMLIAIWRLWP